MSVHVATMEQAERELPPCLVVIQDGRVVQVDEWCRWNMVPWKTIEIRRLDGEDNFFSSVGDPEHGGGSIRGALEHILDGFHPDIQAGYRTLFGLTNVDEAAIKAMKGFERYKVEVRAN